MPLSWEVDASAVRELAVRLGSATPPSEAAVVVDSDGVHVLEGRIGYEIDVDALRSRLESLPARVVPPTSRVAPRVTTAEARATAERIERLTAIRRTILLGSVATVLEPAKLRTLVRVHPGGGGLSVSFDTAALAGLLPASVPARDAEFRFAGSEVEIVPAVQGRIIDAPATALRLTESGSDRVEAAVTLVATGSNDGRARCAWDPRPRLRVHYRTTHLASRGSSTSAGLRV